MTSFAVWLVRNHGQNFTWAHTHQSQTAITPHVRTASPTRVAQSTSVTLDRGSARRCSGTFSLIFLSNCGRYNVQQCLQGQENKVIDAQGQGSRPTSRCTLSNDLNLFPACPSEADPLITERTQSSAVMWFFNRHSPRTALACLCRQGLFCFSSPLMQCV